MKKTFFILLFLTCIFKLNSVAQSVQGGISPGLIFERFDSSDGLPDVRIRNLFQDSKGLLWIGTMNGTASYDGYNFQKYYKGNKGNRISGNWAYALCEDTKGNMWFGTKEGLNRYDTRLHTFKTYRSLPGNQDSLPANVITALLSDQSKLWVGTSKGLCALNEQTGKFKRYHTFPLNQPIANMIAPDPNYLWIAVQNGVIHFHKKSGRFKFYQINVKPNPYGDRFWSMLQDDSKDLYLTTGGDGLIKLPYQAHIDNYGTYEYLNNFGKGQAGLENTQVFDICKSGSGDLWLATERGLAKISKNANERQKLTFYRNNAINNKSISNNIVYKVLIDKNNVLWCGTESGLNKLNLNLLPFHYYTFNDKNIKDQVRSVYAPDGREVWLGTANTGLFRYNTLTNTTDNMNTLIPDISKNCRSLYADRSTLLMGTLTGAVEIKPDSRAVKTILSGKAVFALLKDAGANTWLGTNRGVHQITPDQRNISYEDDPKAPAALRTGFIRSILEDSNGRLWFGLENGGLGVYDLKAKTFIPIEKDSKGNKIAGRNIFCLIEFPRNTFWAGSESGLNKIVVKEKKISSKSISIKPYLESDGLPDQSVNSILADHQGNLWIGTIKGLAKFNPAGHTFRTYLSDITFTPGSYAKTNNHQLIFGANDGFVLFNPEEIKEDNGAPRVMLMELKLFNKTVDIGQAFNGDTLLKNHLSATTEIKLSHLNNVFTLGFTGLHLADPRQNRYAYQMEGFDKDWIYTDASNRTATYTNLNPGTYVFKVRAANYAGKWQKTPASLKITILPPPWKTWWAIAIYILVFNGLLLVFIRYVLIQNRQRTQIRFDKREKEQLRNLDQMKMRFFTDISHEFRTPLSLIVSPVEELLSSTELNGKTRNKMQMVYRNCKKLLYLIEELMTFQKMEQGMLELQPQITEMVTFCREIFTSFQPLAEKKNIRFIFKADADRLLIAADRGKIEMVFNNLLLNAFKFTPPLGQVVLDLCPVEKNGQNWLSLSITDNGKGFTPEESEHLFERFLSDKNIKGTGVGLSLTKNLVELHQGFIAVKSIPAVETSFTVYLPLLAGDTTIIEEEADMPFEPYQTPYPLLTLTDDPHMTEGMEHPQLTLLIVDDNPEILDYLELLFAPRYLVKRAENGLEALKCVEEQEPDLIISDVMMPEMDGIELCRTLKGKLGTCHIPLILLTARTTVEDKLRGVQMGADDYIAKPFHPNILLAKSAQLMETRRKLISKYQLTGVIVPEDISRNPMDEEFLQKVITAIEHNIGNENFGVEQLGDIVCMSRSHLFRKLKAITGHNPLDIIYGTRLKRAMELLLGRRKNISEIAWEVGFKNPSSFTAAFKKQYGKTPSEYLNQLRSDEKKHTP